MFEKIGIFGSVIYRTVEAVFGRHDAKPYDGKEVQREELSDMVGAYDDPDIKLRRRVLDNVD
jgi:hypothetical protein